MAKSNHRIGYILKYGDNANRKFRYREDTYQRKITSRGDRVYCKMLYPTDYEEVQHNTEIMRENGLILVCEPFFVDDEIRAKVTRWVEWANNTNPKEYDPFYLVNEYGNFAHCAGYSDTMSEDI